MSDHNANEALQKKVDEAWKESVAKESAAGNTEPHEPLEVTFNLFITTLMMEALVALGEIEHPATKKKERNPTHAKFLIDTLAMLQEKTKNNLAKEEADMIDAYLYELRMRFIGGVPSAEPRVEKP